MKCPFEKIGYICIKIDDSNQITILLDIFDSTEYIQKVK